MKPTRASVLVRIGATGATVMSIVYRIDARQRLFPIPRWPVVLELPERQPPDALAKLRPCFGTRRLDQVADNPIHIPGIPLGDDQVVQAHNWADLFDLFLKPCGRADKQIERFLARAVIRTDDGANPLTSIRRVLERHISQQATFDSNH